MASLRACDLNANGSIVGLDACEAPQLDSRRPRIVCRRLLHRPYCDGQWIATWVTSVIHGSAILDPGFYGVAVGQDEDDRASPRVRRALDMLQCVLVSEDGPPCAFSASVLACATTGSQVKGCSCVVTTSSPGPLEAACAMSPAKREGLSVPDLLFASVSPPRPPPPRSYARALLTHRSSPADPAIHGDELLHAPLPQPPTPAHRRQGRAPADQGELLDLVHNPLHAP